MHLIVEGQPYKIMRRWKSRRSGKVLVGIYNDNRQQYEVYYRHQNPMLVPMGTDEYSMQVAFALAVDDANNRIRY